VLKRRKKHERVVIDFLIFCMRLHPASCLEPIVACETHHW